MGHDRPTNAKANVPDMATTSPSGRNEATPSAQQAQQHLSQAESSARTAPRTLATGINWNNAEDAAYVPSEATLEDVRIWNQEWFANLSVRLWHPTRRMPVYDESDLFVYFANANFNRIVRHRYVEASFPAPLSMSDSGAEASHWSMPSIARFDNRIQPLHDLSLDELPDYDTWLLGLQNLGGPRAINERPSHATLASQVDKAKSSTAPKDLAMGFEVGTAPAENVGPDSSVVGGGLNEQQASSEAEKHSTPQKPKEERSFEDIVPPPTMNSSAIMSSILEGTINVPRVYQQADFDEDITIYGLERYLQLLMEPLSTRASPNASIPVAMNEQDNRSIQERVEQSGSIFVRESSPDEATVYDVQRYAFFDSVQTTPNLLRANLPWRYPEPMEVIGEVTEEMISAVSSQWSVSNVVAEPSAASEPSQSVQPNASQRIDDTAEHRQSASPPMTPPFVFDTTLTLEEAAMAPFRQSLSPVRSVNGDRVYVQYPRAYFIELPDSDDDSMCDQDAQPMQRDDHVLKDVSAELDGTQKSESSAVDEESMDIDECVLRKDNEDVLVASRDPPVFEQMLDETQESQSDESMLNDDSTPMELDNVDLDDFMKLDDTQMSESPVADEIMMEDDQGSDEACLQNIGSQALNDTSVSSLKKNDEQESDATEDDDLTKEAVNALKWIQNAYCSSEEDEEMDAEPGNASEAASQSDMPMQPDDGPHEEVRENREVAAASRDDDAATMLKPSGGLKRPQSKVNIVAWSKTGHMENAGLSSVPEMHQDDQSDVDTTMNNITGTEANEGPMMMSNANGFGWNRYGFVKAGPSNIPEVPAADDRDADIDMPDSDDDDDQPSSSGSSSSNSGNTEVEESDIDSDSITGSDGNDADLESDASRRRNSDANKPKYGKKKSTRSRPRQIVSSCTQTIACQDMESLPHCPTCRCEEHSNTSIDQVELAYREWDEAVSTSMRDVLSDRESDGDEMQETMPPADPRIAHLVNHLDDLVQQCKRLISTLESARSADNDSLEAVRMDEAQRLAELEARIAAELADGAVPCMEDGEVPQRLITSSDNLSDSSFDARQDLIDQDMDDAAALTPPQHAEIDLDAEIVEDIDLDDFALDASLNESPASPMLQPPAQPDINIDQMPEQDVVPLEDDESVFNTSHLDEREYGFSASPMDPEAVSEASSIVNPADLQSSDGVDDIMDIADSEYSDDGPGYSNIANLADLESSDEESGTVNIADLESSDEEQQSRPNSTPPQQIRDEDMEIDPSDDDQPRRHRRAPRMVHPRPNRRQRRAVPYVVPQPRGTRTRRSRPINPEFGQLQHITDIDGVNLPNAPPVVNMRHLFVVDNTDLSADQQVMVVNGDHFQAALYRSGHVVLLGPFDGAPMGSALLRQAVGQPVVIWNNLDDPIEEIAAGANHLIMRSEAGRLFTIGQATHGQLGVPNPQWYRQSDLRPDMLLRQVFDGFREVTFSAIRAVGNNSFAIAKNGKVYSCGQDYGDLFQ